MQDEAHLMAKRRAAAGAIGLVHLDQILGLAARAVEGVVDVLGRTGAEPGDDIADVEVERSGLDARRQLACL